MVMVAGAPTHKRTCATAVGGGPSSTVAAGKKRVTAIGGRDSNLDTGIRPDGYGYVDDFLPVGGIRT
jgi:hypothetical protein